MTRHKDTSLRSTNKSRARRPCSNFGEEAWAACERYATANGEPSVGFPLTGVSNSAIAAVLDGTVLPCWSQR